MTNTNSIWEEAFKDINFTLVTLDDIHDELIRPAVKKTDFEDMVEYIRDFVNNIANIELNEMVQPIPYKLKQLCIVFICKNVCLNKSFSASLSTRSSESKDSWSEKLAYYLQQQNALEKSITAEMLLGEKTSQYGTIEIQRC